MANSRGPETLDDLAKETGSRPENLIHDYDLLNANSQVATVRDALHQAAEMLKEHLK